MRRDYDYSNSRIAIVIDEYVHNAKYREILKLRWIDGITQEKVAEIVDMSVRQIKNIDYWFEQKVLLKHEKELNI